MRRVAAKDPRAPRGSMIQGGSEDDDDGRDDHVSS
jgi:hypothetical protein